MTDILARRTLRQTALPEAIEAVHTELDKLWDDASFVPDLDRMTFATAVIEAASNVVQHAVPESTKPVELGVDISATSVRLEARVSAFNAVCPDPIDTDAAMPDGEAESGRGLALIRALVTTVTFKRQDGTNTWILSKSPLRD
ncbi:ATP-binding protein [Arthrobacter humicola]|jgi:serine/threonine-protein kinase RsbW|uniref:ATP-binding protein n=1 Tax=Arthrobacter humicola TaxID=409291 RepID=UPI001FAD1F1F|nr:ATP-binding protein [Arthrobacter humicola]MCI9870154.1 ATP-binding protein [Arthrobacter humicola]